MDKKRWLDNINRKEQSTGFLDFLASLNDLVNKEGQQYSDQEIKDLFDKIKENRNLDQLRGAEIALEEKVSEIKEIMSGYSAEERSKPGYQDLNRRFDDLQGILLILKSRIENIKPANVPGKVISLDERRGETKKEQVAREKIRDQEAADFLKEWNSDSNGGDGNQQKDIK